MDTPNPRDEVAPRVTIADVGMQCSTCFYWLPIGERELGRCMRNPPQSVTSDQRGKVVSGFPLACAEDVCGEWSTDQQPPDRLGLAEIGG